MQQRQKFDRSSVEQQQSNNNNNNDDDNEQQQETSSSLQRFKVTVAYDGTDFCGWQIQNDKNNSTTSKNPSSPQSATSIQARIEQRLSSIFLGKPFGLAIAGSGRTDSGVHAKGQVFHFDAPSEIRIPDKKQKQKQKKNNDDNTSVATSKAEEQAHKQQQMMKTIKITPEKVLQFLSGSGLPPSIQILNVEGPFVPGEFHARESCIKKRYEYTICEGTASPFETRFCYSLGLSSSSSSSEGTTTSSSSSLNIEKMKQAASYLIGKHNFSAFGVIEDGDPRDPVKNMELIEIERFSTKSPFSFDEKNNNHSSFVKITAQCDRFLWHMMRMVSGTLIDVGLGRIEPEDVKKLLDEQQRGASHQTAKVRVRTAPAQGLCLVKVFY